MFVYNTIKVKDMKIIEAGSVIEKTSTTLTHNAKLELQPWYFIMKTGMMVFPNAFLSWSLRSGVEELFNSTFAIFWSGEPLKPFASVLETVQINPEKYYTLHYSMVA